MNPIASESVPPTDQAALQVARVFARAVELFGDEDMASGWFATPAEYVQGEAPISPRALAETAVGARLIESRIRRTAHGLF